MSLESDIEFLMNVEIDSDVPIPILETRSCCDCNLLKPITEFSLKRGKQSAERKPFCTKCEYERRKSNRTKPAGKFLELPCSICGQESKSVDIAYDISVGVLCKRCKEIVISPDLFSKISNYMKLRAEFPGIAHDGLLALANMENNEMPLFQWIEDAT